MSGLALGGWCMGAKRKDARALPGGDVSTAFALSVRSNPTTQRSITHHRTQRLTQYSPAHDRLKHSTKAHNAASSSAVLPVAAARVTQASAAPHVRLPATSSGRRPKRSTVSMAAG